MHYKVGSSLLGFYIVVKLAHKAFPICYVACPELTISNLFVERELISGLCTVPRRRRLKICENCVESQSNFVYTLLNSMY
jgi:hypothetical protein